MGCAVVRDQRDLALQLLRLFRDRCRRSDPVSGTLFLPKFRKIGTNERAMATSGVFPLLDLLSHSSCSVPPGAPGSEEPPYHDAANGR